MKLSKRRAMEKVGKTKLSKQKDLVVDPRFSRLHTDPRFQRPVKRKLKIPIDSRFGHIFSDSLFSGPLALDKRGRKLRNPKRKRSSKSHPLRQYYHISDDDDDGGESNEGKHRNGRFLKQSLSKELQSNENHHPTNERAKRELSSRSSSYFTDGKNECPVELLSSNQADDINKPIPSAEDGLGCPEVQLVETSNSEEETDVDDVSEESLMNESTSSLSSGDSSEEDDTADSPSEEIEEEKVPLTENETPRLALVNMDWDHIRAVDILAVMNSFLPKGGQILSVTVFPSEFGLQQMKEEEKRGPKGLFQSESSDEDKEDTDEDLTVERLRQYEKDKLRYYYAVVEFDSKESANFCYKSCDGMEFERTSNTLDLRFIPDDMKFSNEPRDFATEVPSDYQAPRFETQALQHSRVKLTWDDDEPDRVKTLHQKFNADQLNDMDFKAYLASDDSDTDLSNEVEENFINYSQDSKRDLDNVTSEKTANGRKESREKYRALLLGSEEVYQGKDKPSNDQDMEITFHSGLEELSKRLMDKSKQKGTEETVWEAYLRKKKEKRKLQRQQSKNGSEDAEDSGDDHDAQIDSPIADGDLGFDDPFFKDMEHNASASNSEGELPTIPVRDRKSGTQAQKKHNREEEERSRAELELLFADELDSGSLVKGYNLKKKRKGNRKNKEDSDAKFPMANYDDPRFSAVLTSHSFAIDPTAPEYARSAAQLRPLLQKQQKCLPHIRETADSEKPEASKTEDVISVNARKEKQELSMMVRSLKRKVGAAMT